MGGEGVPLGVQIHAQLILLRPLIVHVNCKRILVVVKNIQRYKIHFGMKWEKDWDDDLNYLKITNRGVASGSSESEPIVHVPLLAMLGSTPGLPTDALSSNSDWMSLSCSGSSVSESVLCMRLFFFASSMASAERPGRPWYFVTADMLPTEKPERFKSRGSKILSS